MMRFFPLSNRAARLFIVVLLTAALPNFLPADDSSNLVVVFPGGPNPGSSGQRVIDDFVAKINETVAAPLQGGYFNDSEKALAFLKENPHSFVLGSTGFFLSARKELGLSPMLRVILPNEKPEQYFLVSQKGAFSGLSELKGKKVSGSPFFESAQFLDRIVFDGEIATGDHFSAEPTGRPLSALRKLTSGDLDAVLLAAPQFHGLAALPLAEELDVVFESKSITSVGMMRIDNETTARTAPALQEALVNLSKTPEGAEAAKGFGVSGFAEIEDDAVKTLIETYEAP